MCHPRFNAHVDTMCRPDIQVQDHVLPTGCKARPGASAAAGSMVRGIRFTSGMTGIRSISTTAGRHGAVVVKVQAKAADDGLSDCAGNCSGRGSSGVGTGRAWGEALARTGKIWFCVLTASRWWDCPVGF